MSKLSDQITAELRLLVGQPLWDVGRLADMAMFGFGGRRASVDGQGRPIEVSEISLHLQCRWRLVDSHKILFGRDDLNLPADAAIPLDEFDYDRHESLLDARFTAWLDRGLKPHVTDATGDRYGGFRMALEHGLVLEAFPCDSAEDDEAEHWRLFGHREAGKHFVVCGLAAMHC